MTNREKLMQMSDEDLAKWLCEHNIKCRGCPCYDWKKGCKGPSILDKWLREESKDDRC